MRGEGRELRSVMTSSIIFTPIGWRMLRHGGTHRLTFESCSIPRWRGLWPRWRRVIRSPGGKAWWPLLPRWSSQTWQLVHLVHLVHQQGLTQVLSGPAPLLNRIQLGTLVKTQLPSTPCPRSKGSEEEAHRGLATHIRRLVKDRKRRIFTNLRWRWNAVFLWSSRLDYHRCQGEVISWLNNSERLLLFSLHNCCRLVVCVCRSNYSWTCVFHSQIYYHILLYIIISQPNILSNSLGLNDLFWGQFFGISNKILITR